MNEYELTYILHPRLNVDEANATVERINQQIATLGGQVRSQDNWGRRRLAYPIEHHFEGTYVLTTMDFPAEQTRALEQYFRLSEDVIRHLLIRGIIPYEGQPPEERSTRRGAEDRGEREERPPREEEPRAEAAEPVPAGSAPAATDGAEEAAEPAPAEAGIEAETADTEAETEA